ncbi:dTDP-glucose 4,6-dehydratase [Pontixanthobacter gangjinensis]|uniref:dTDP-glucose 4,6-dehydratase n=1 Tax=Christiangramia aestuarii TaxID=1028746 RepID=A0A7K1LN27_9FLAO|nr:dTDP-glucose 4,6-dehydratase [Christiangramia aestuarii]MUP42206.1 dTDP-glucose 4,6-dehydratase [Christiangramia aestuarii]
MNLKDRSILITGGAGFIGSNFIPLFLQNNPGVKLVNLDLLTYAGNLENLEQVNAHPDYTFVKGDICDRELVREVFQKYKITGVINFAAESHVDNSIAGPEVFIRTNVNGTFTLLDVAYRYWMDSPFSPKKGQEENRFHHISTDEVYGSLGEKGYFTERTPYAPNSPYSASKASSDMLVRSYRHTYGLNTLITNCSNNYGPRQHQEKLIPTIIRKALAGEAIPIYGDGKNVRDWLYVKDHCRAIDLVFKQGRPGEVYNIGGDAEKNNISIAKLICEHLDKKQPKASGSYKDQIEFVQDRPGHDRRYAIDASKIKKELGWKARESFDSGILKTIDWYLALNNETINSKQ